MMPKPSRPLADADNGKRNAEVLRELIDDISIFLEKVDINSANYHAHYNASNKELIEAAANSIRCAESLEPVHGKWHCTKMPDTYDSELKTPYFDMSFTNSARRKR